MPQPPTLRFVPSAAQRISWCLQDARSNGSTHKGRLSPALVSRFDMVTCYSSSNSDDVESEDRLVEYILDLSPGKAELDDRDRASLKRCLEEHLRRAASTAAPKPSKQASLMLQKYYMVMSCVSNIQHRDMQCNGHNFADHVAQPSAETCTAQRCT